MKIEANNYVAIDYKLSLDSGEVVDHSQEGKPLGFVFGYGQLIEGLERQLKGQEEGFSAKLSVEAQDAYGEYQQDLVRDIPKSSFPADCELQPGMVFQTNTPQGMVMTCVKEVRDDVVVADFNHPLAGEKLHFDIKVVQVRKASQEELQASEHNCDADSCQGCGQH